MKWGLVKRVYTRDLRFHAEALSRCKELPGNTERWTGIQARYRDRRESV